MVDRIPVIDFDQSGAFAGFDLADSISINTRMPDELLRARALELSAYRLQIEPMTEADLPLLLEDSYTKLSKEIDPARLLNQQKNAVIAKYRELEMDALSQGIVGDIVTDQQLVEESLKNTALIEEAYRGNVGSFLLTNDSFSNQSTNDVKDFATYRLAEELGTRGIFDKVVDFTALIVPDFTFDMSDLMKTGLWGSIDGFTKEVSLVQRLPPNLQMQYLNERIPEVVDAFDNNALKAAMVTSMYTDPDFYNQMLVSGVLDATAIGELLTVPFQIATGFARGVSSVNRLKNMGRPDLAAMVNQQIASKAVNSEDQLTAAMNASPFEFERLLIERGNVDGISAEGQKILQSIQRSAEARRSRLSDTEFQKLAGLNEEEKILYQNQVVEEFNTIIDELATSAPKTTGVYSKAEVVSSGEFGFVVKYTVSGEEKVIPIRYTRDVVGNWIAMNPNFLSSTLMSFGRRLFSQETLLRNIDDSIVPNVTAIGNQSAIVRNVLTKEAKNLDKGLSLSKAERHEVDALLLAGDERGMVYGIDELLNGTVEINGTKKLYTPDQVRSYYNHVNFFKELGATRNNMVRSQLEFEGYQALRIKPSKTRKGGTYIARPVDITESSAAARLKQSPMVYAPQNGNRPFVHVGEFMSKNDNLSGWTFMELREPMYIGRGKAALLNPEQQVHYAVVRTGKNSIASIDSLPTTVLQFQRGYVPRIRKPGYFWVKETTGAHLRTISAFDKREDAIEYAATLNEKAASRKKQKFYEVFDDREVLPGERWKDDMELTGGTLFTGSRARHRILINGSRSYVPRDTRLDTAASTQLYIENISSAMPLNEYRSAMIQRYINTVHAIAKSEKLPNGGFSIAGDFRSPLLIRNPDLKRKMEIMRDFMLTQLNIQSNEEKAFGRAMTFLSTHMENKALFDWKLPFTSGSIRNGVLWLAAKDPTSMLKGATFSAHLGWFNIRQFFIQAHNSSLALSAYPQHALQIANAMFMRPLAYTLFNSNWKAAANIAARALGRSPEEYIKELELFKQSGLYDSITRLADYQAAVQSLTPGTFSMLQKLSRAGQIFFNEGEIMSRLIGFQISKKQYLKLTGKNTMDLTHKDALEIGKDALRVMMNLQRENSAWWQSAPIIGNITQFAQVHTKLIEKLVGGLWQGGAPLGKGISQAQAFGGSRWTRGEATRALMGQILFYGTVGVPVAEEIMSYITEVTGTKREDINPTIVETVERGMLGVYMQALGMNNNVSEDVSLVAGLDDIVIAKIIQSMFDGERINWWQTFGGPSINVMQRSGDAMGNIIQRLNVLFHYPSMEAIQDLMVGATDDIASITSTWSNAKKAWHLYSVGTPEAAHHHMALEQSGLYNIQTVLGKAMGFKTDVEVAQWRLRASINKDIAKDRKETVDSMEKAFLLFKQTNNYNSFVASMTLIMRPYSEYEQMEIMDAFLNRVYPKQATVSTEISEFVRHYITSDGTRPIPAAVRRLMTQEVTQ